MLTLFRRGLCFALVALMLVSSEVSGYTANSQLAGDEGVILGEEACEEGWLYTHTYCLQYTGLPAEEANVFCAQQGAQQAQGICVKKPRSSVALSLESSMEEKEGDLVTLSPQASSDSIHECPRGWNRFRDFCYFKLGAIPKVCDLLGAEYIFNYCVTRVPHQLSTDFMRTVKRLDGGEFDMHRDTRLCCCRGGGFCK